MDTLMRRKVQLKRRKVCMGLDPFEKNSLKIRGNAGVAEVAVGGPFLTNSLRPPHNLGHGEDF